MHSCVHTHTHTHICRIQCRSLGNATCPGANEAGPTSLALFSAHHSGLSYSSCSGQKRVCSLFHWKGQSSCLLCVSHVTLFPGSPAWEQGYVTRTVMHVHALTPPHTHLLVMLSLHMQSNSRPEGGEENDVAEHSESETDRAVEKDSLLINKQHN